VSILPLPYGKKRREARNPGPRRARRVLLLAIVGCFAAVGVATAALVAFNPFGNQQVEGTYANGVLLPTNQWISPLGTRAFTDNARILTSSLSPDGKTLAALTWNDYDTTLTLLNLTTDKSTAISLFNGFKVKTAPDPYANEDGTIGTDGPLWSSDGNTIWVPQTDYLDKFTYDSGTGTWSQADAIWLCATGTQANPAPDCDTYGPGDKAGSDQPAGMALSADGSKLYVALTGSDALGVIDTATDQLTGEIPVGNAPRQVVISADGSTAYVSNEGGRPANSTDFTNQSDGTNIVSSPVTGAATTGTVSVVNLNTAQETQEIPVGLQPTALYQDGSALFVANSNDDSMSVINEQTNAVAQTVTTNPVPGASVGSYANAISMPDPGHVLVSIGRDNAVADYSYNGLNQPLHLDGLLPTDWYPVQAQPDPALGAGAVVVTNDKGIGAQGPESTINKGAYTSSATGHNTYDDTGSVTVFTMPTSAAQLGQDTQTVFRDNAWNQIKPINDGSYDDVPSVIPKQLGGQSKIKHIVVIIKENRSYDQVLGDLGMGNGDPALAQFGAQVTPNAHALAGRFGDLDNFYDEGTLSADGHNWIVQAEANDYVEKEFGAFYRSYPSQGGDALAYQRDGFLWNAAEKAGVSVQNFGEYIFNPYNLPADTPEWDAWYAESQWLENGHQGPEPISNPCQYTKVQSDIPSLQAISAPCFPNFQLTIPDQYRVDQWLPYFQQDVQTGQMPQLTFMWLMTDHTTGSDVPDPVAQVADNDLAVGRVVSAISHSKFWKSTAIFVDEDDTQNGVDHVDGHRAPTLVISPYSRPGVDDQYYSQLNMVKTVEQILGIKAMNQEDYAAEPMYAAFTNRPDFAPFDLQPNQIPLNLGAPGGPTTLSTPLIQSSDSSKQASIARKDFHVQGVIPAGMRHTYDAWKAWLAAEGRKGRFNGPDRINAEQLNHYDWYSAHDWKVAYPGESKIFLPGQVPGRKLPAAFIGN
jgi:YVTN family beta-propeller protein